MANLSCPERVISRRYGYIAAAQHRAPVDRQLQRLRVFGLAVARRAQVFWVNRHLRSRVLSRRASRCTSCRLRRLRPTQALNRSGNRRRQCALRRQLQQISAFHSNLPHFSVVVARQTHPKPARIPSGQSTAGARAIFSRRPSPVKRC